MRNCFGTKLRIEIFGASHAPSAGVTIEGIPAGIQLSAADFEHDLAARRAGAAGTTPRREADVPEIEGTVAGLTTGAPVTITFRNENTRSGDYSAFEAHPRPSHVDFTARRKYGPEFDLRGSGIFSGRMTVALVAAGVIAKKILPQNIRFFSEIVELGGSRDKSQFKSIIESAVADGDSVGGVVECRAEGLPVGLGEPYFDSVESVASHLLFSIPAVKGVEFGSGFEGVRLRGSQRNDRIISSDGTTATNNEGGINGGITNGNPLVARVAIKPTASIGQPQQTFNFEHNAVEPLLIGGRHDACIVVRARIVAEAAIAIALADLWLQYQSSMQQ